MQCDSEHKWNYAIDVAIARNNFILQVERNQIAILLFPLKSGCVSHEDIIKRIEELIETENKYIQGTRV